jgi:site-specific DNA-methyltransferase (adenine-specific)
MISLPNATVYHGSNLDVLPTLPDNSVDSIVTDPPYELGFMGKSWDNSGIAYSVELWTECMRVLKPGGHLLAFGGSRTWHRLAVAIEDAGFEMRDSIAWLYGSGFPKSLDVSKAIDKAAGAEREVIGSKAGQPGYSLAESKGNLVYSGGFGGSGNPVRESEITAPATPEAQQWQGWGTALKPAFEPVVVARKPLGEKTVAANVLAYGTGGLNIDASRIGTEERINQPGSTKPRIAMGDNWNPDAQPTTATGRWPANIILDPYTAELLDEQSGVSNSGKIGVTRQATSFNANTYGDGIGKLAGQSRGDFGDSGGASRFFYVAKASKKDRNEGLEELEGKEIGAKGNGLARACATCGATVLDGCDCPDRTFVNPTRQNFHPTVKPTALMEYLIKLVTPEGGTVLDPFTGSGSTGKAALLNGYQFIGIELTDEYLPIIEGRLKWANEQASKKEEEKSEVLF